MAIKPFPTKIVLKLKEMQAGALDLTNQNILSEVGEVVALGEEIKNGEWKKTFGEGFELKVGDIVAVKIWGCDHMEIDGESYYVTDISSKALLAIIE